MKWYRAVALPEFRAMLSHGGCRAFPAQNREPSTSHRWREEGACSGLEPPEARALREDLLGAEFETKVHLKARE